MLPCVGVFGNDDPASRVGERWSTLATVNGSALTARPVINVAVSAADFNPRRIS
jgi:hypothetical protein